MSDTLDLGQWCILRMASCDTLAVANSLRAAGFEVWTPVERKIARRPKTRAQYETTTALLPSYVFAAVDRIEDLARIALTPNRDHPRFSMFKHQGGFPLVADIELEALRYTEDKRRTIFERLRDKGKRGPIFTKGARVKTDKAGFAGLSGIVEDQRGQFTMVSYASFHKPIKIASILLLPDAVTESSSGNVCQAA